MFSFYFLNDQAYGSEDLLITENLFGWIYEQNVSRCGKLVLLSAPCFANATFAQIALDSSLEAFLWYGYKNPGMVASGIFAYQIAHARNISVPTLGKQFLNKGLAAESFFFLECI